MNDTECFQYYSICQYHIGFDNVSISPAEQNHQHQASEILKYHEELNLESL